MLMISAGQTLCMKCLDLSCRRHSTDLTDVSAVTAVLKLYTIAQNSL